MLKVVQSLIDRLAWAAERVVMVTFGVMVIAVLASVVTRNISIPVTWLEELSRYMQIWFVSVGFALALRKGMLAGTEVLIKILPVRISSKLIVVCKMLMLIITMLLLYFSTPLIHHLINTGQESPNMRIPVWWIYMGIYSGFTLAACFISSSLLANVFGEKDDLDKTFMLESAADQEL